MKKIVTFLVLMIISGITGCTSRLSAHGYVISPASRNYQGVMDKNNFGYNWAFSKYGGIINEPQSLEYLKGFPGSGPADGQLASAGGAFGGVLDIQTADRWKKQNISSGINSFVWYYTANHATTKWHYYITKVGWNPNQPLKRSDFEHIGTIQGNGTQPSQNVSHQIMIPQNRTGYHVILAVWDIEDTANAFYNVIDVNVGNNAENPIAPNIPTGLSAQNVTANSAKILWNVQANAISYIIFRNNQQLQETSGPPFQDQGLLPNSLYNYRVQAKGSTGLTSALSLPLPVQTSAPNPAEMPTVPANLHSMGSTESSVSLMWVASTHSEGIKHYEIYQQGVKIFQTTNTYYTVSGLLPNTVYQFTVKAVGQNDVVSNASNELIVKTKNIINAAELVYCGAKVYDPGAAYPNSNTSVFYNCKVWRNKWYANANEFPGNNMVWEEVSFCSEGSDCQNSQPQKYCGAEEYNHLKVYSQINTLVFYDCKIWKNKWYANAGEIPGQSSTWMFISACTEKPDCVLNNKFNTDEKIIGIFTGDYFKFVKDSYYLKIISIDIFNSNGIKIFSSGKISQNFMHVPIPTGVYYINILQDDGMVIRRTIKK